MGTWQTFDTAQDRSPLVAEAFAAGIDLFDSSPMYGRAEAALARALGSLRKQALVATKVWTQNPEDGEAQASSALSRFGKVDIYQVHNLVNWKTQLRLLERLKGEGKVSAIGATHYLPSAFGELCDVMRTGRLDMIQMPYTPRLRDAEIRVLPLAAELGVGVLVHSPLRFGVLEKPVAPQALLDFGVNTTAQLVLKWIASDPRVSCVLTATRTAGRAAENGAAGDPPWLDAKQREQVASLLR